MEPGTTITITRKGGRFVATFKAPSSKVIRFASVLRAGEALDVFGTAITARRLIDSLFMFARVDAFTATYNDGGWSSELKYWRDGEIREHCANATTLPAAIMSHITYLLKGE